MKTMKKDVSAKQSALVLDTKLDPWESSTGFRKVEIPVPALNEKKDPKDALAVLIKVRYAGVCGTDRGIWKRQVFKERIHDSLKAEKKTARIMGHEFTGTILETGSQVSNIYGIKVGDNVSGDSHITCGHCFYCRLGEEEVCQDQKIMGIGIDGVFAQYIKIPAKNLWQVDFTRVRPEITSILDPFGNAVHACSKVNLGGKRVAILGCGPIGMFTILLANAFGAAKVIAIDTNKVNLLMAKKLGAHETFLLSSHASIHANADLVKYVQRITYGKGVDVAFEMAGPNSSVNNAILITRNGGDVILFGLRDGDFAIPNFRDIIVRGLRLHGVIGRQIFQTWQTSQRMLSNKANGIQDKIWNIILKRGKDIMLPLKSYTKELCEEKMAKHPKVILEM